MSNSISSVSDSSNNGEQDALEVQAAVPEVVTPEPRPISAATDPFDPVNLSRMRLSQDFTALAEVRPVITSVAVRKPLKQEFVRVRPGDEWRYPTTCFVDKENGETYLVAPALLSEMPGDLTPTALVVAMNRNSPVPFLWPLVLPSPDGRSCRWYDSAIEAARLANSKWLRCVADNSANCYIPYVAKAALPEPVWPADLTMADLLRLAFQGRMIDDINHICLRRLRGEI